MGLSPEIAGWPTMIIQTGAVAASIADHLYNTHREALGLKFCQVGNVSHLVGESDVGLALPCIFVMPQQTNTAALALGQPDQPSDVFRVVYVTPFDVQTNATQKAIDEAGQIADNLLIHPQATFIAVQADTTVRMATVLGIQWIASPEQIELDDLGIRAKVVTINYAVFYDVLA